jgi:hypothetical protein
MEPSLAEQVAGAERPLFLGVGGGGDIVGAYAVARTLTARVRSPLVGGLSWERRPLDPVPRPRRIDEMEKAVPLSECVAWAGPETRVPNGVVFAESRLAACLGFPTVIADPSGGATTLAVSLVDAARTLGSDMIVLVDVGGDVLAKGDERCLVSPLCDAICLAMAPMLSPHVDVVGAIVGAGCDGELTLEELSGRLGLVAAANDGLESRSLTPQAIDSAAEVVEEIQTEASRFMLECARGSSGVRSIRDGARSVHLSPFGSIIFLFDPVLALEVAAPLARAAAVGDFFEAADAIRALGSRTEIDPGDQGPLPAPPHSLNGSSTFGKRWLQVR